MNKPYDAIVVGARCAGSPVAMLLARKGYRVLLLDRAGFPSDTMSTHQVHPPGVAALARWGLLERLQASGCPPITQYSFDFGPIRISGSPRPIDGIATAYCPRRTVLDQLLVHAAVAAGAELREGFAVDRVMVEDGRVTGVRGRTTDGSTTTETGRVVVGADGRHSLVAKSVTAPQYQQRPSRMSMYYAYWSGLPVGGFDTTIRAAHRRGWAAIPTHDGLTVLGFGWPIDEFKANRRELERSFFATIDLAPDFAERVREAKRESKFIGTADLAGYFRKPFGEGWVLVGDAGYHKNPITAMGINDAFRDAELVAAALDDAFSGRRSFEQGMSDYQRARDRVAGPVYEFTDEFAKLEPPRSELLELFAAMRGNQDAMDEFVSVQADTLAAPEFFSPENVRRITSHSMAT